MTDVKICGITDQAALEAGISAGARYIGFVFYGSSPRHLSAQTAAALAKAVPPGIYKVGLFVDPEDDVLDKVLSQVPLDILQLHGKESPGRVADIKHRTGKQIIKAISVAEPADLDFVPGYAVCADWLMFDAKTDKALAAAGGRPGGNGLAFDWRILEGFSAPRPWLLAGGLDVGNVGAAIALLHPDAVDVSSGVETPSGSGRKDPEKIAGFLQEVAKADARADAAGAA